MSQYTEDVGHIESLFARSPTQSRQISPRRAGNELTCQEVRVLLEYNSSKGVDDDTISHIVKKQIILEKRNMFDPGRYFGSPHVEDLEDAPDKRIDLMFQKSNNESCSNSRSQSQTRMNRSHVAVMLNHKKPVKGVSDALKYALTNCQKITSSTCSVKPTLNLSSSTKMLTFKHNIRDESSCNKQNKENSMKLNRTASNRVISTKIDKHTPLQKLRLKLKIHRQS